MLYAGEVAHQAGTRLRTQDVPLEFDKLLHGQRDESYKCQCRLIKVSLAITFSSLMPSRSNFDLAYGLPNEKSPTFSIGQLRSWQHSLMSRVVRVVHTEASFAHCTKRKAWKGTFHSRDAVSSWCITSLMATDHAGLRPPAMGHLRSLKEYWHPFTGKVISNTTLSLQQTQARQMPSGVGVRQSLLLLSWQHASFLWTYCLRSWCTPEILQDKASAPFIQENATRSSGPILCFIYCSIYLVLSCWLQAILPCNVWARQHVPKLILLTWGSDRLMSAWRVSKTSFW